MSNTELLIEDLTDEFYECGTHQVKHWLISNSDHTGLSKEQINQLSIKQLKDVFINSSLTMIGLTARHTNGRRYQYIFDNDYDLDYDLDYENNLKSFDVTY